MTKAGELESVRTIIDMKEKIGSALAKYNRLNITFRTPPPGEETSLEEQPEPVKAKKKPVETETDWKFGTKAAPNLELDPTTPQAQLAILKKKLTK